MLATTHLRRERPACFDDATGTSAAATGETGGGGERVLRGQSWSMPPDRDTGFGRNVGRGGDNVLIGGGGVAWFVGGVDAGGGGGGRAKVSPLAAPPAPPPTPLCNCDSRNTESIPDISGLDGGISNCRCDFPGKSVLLDGGIWLAHFER